MNVSNFEAQSAHDAVAVTPSDSANLSLTPTQSGTLPKPFALYVGGAGDVKVDLESGATVTFKAVPVGTTLMIRVRKVYATGTSATNLVALYQGI